MSVLPPISHVRLLDIGLSDFLDPKQFDATYLKILSHLNLEFPLIRYDFVQYWLDRQDSYIKPFIAKMFAS